MTVAKPIAACLTIVLAGVFTLTGIMKLTPLISPAAHSHLSSEFPRYLLALQFDRLGMDDVTLRVLVGIIEVFSAVALLLPGVMNIFGIAALKIVMVGAIFTHLRLGERPYPAVVLLGLLFVLSTLKTKLEAPMPAAPVRATPPDGTTKQKSS